MGVWLGPMGKVKDLSIFAPGDEGLFSKVTYQITPAGYNVSDWSSSGVPTFANSVASIVNHDRYGDGSAWQNTSGIVVRGPFDLTKYRTVKFKYANAGTDSVSARFYVSASGNSVDWNGDIHADAVSGSSGGEASLDVSALSGSYYVGIALFSGGNSRHTTSVQMTEITATA